MLSLRSMGMILLRLAFIAPLSCSLVWAVEYPTRPVRFIVPFPPGGNIDTHARLVGQRLSEVWRKQAVIDNRPGAGGNIGMAMAAQAPADGHTLVWAGASTLAVSPHIYKNLGYNLEKDFTPVIRAVDTQNVLVVHPSIQVQTVKELIVLARARPGALSFASSGSGTISHLGGEMFKIMSKTDLVHVPYKGSSLAMADLLSGQVQVMWDSLTSAMPQVRASKLRALAVTGKKRTPLAPELPTMAESGLPEFEIVNWLGILAPRGVSKEIIRELSTDLNAVLGSADMREKMMKYGAEPATGTPEEFARYISTDRDRWGVVAKKVGVTPK